MIATSQPPGWIPSPASPGSIEIVTMILVLLMWAWWKREVHKMRDGGLSLPAMWILHTEQLSFCILIQSSELFAVLMLGLAVLLIPRYWTRSRIAGNTSTSTLGPFVREELLRQ